MIIYSEVFSVCDLNVCSGGKDTLDAIISSDKECEFFGLMEEIFCGEASEVEINDWLWFDRDNILEMLGISEDEQEDDDKE